MPDILEGLGEYPLKLLSEFEVGPDGVPATESYECSGGRWTLGLGATEWPTGKPIGPGEFCTPEQAIELTNWHVRKYLGVVDRTITKPMTVNQRGAMALMAYNIGPSAFASSSVAKRFNDGDRPENIAEAFGMWCKATNDTPDRHDIGKAYYDAIIGTNANGSACWVGPVTNPPKGWEIVRDSDQFWAMNPNPPPPHDPALGPPPADLPPVRIPLGIRPRDYQKAMPGLLRRHLSEGMLFLNLDWRQACRKDTVSIVSNRIWDPNNQRWEDIVRTKTELSDLLPQARGYPLPEPVQAVSPIPAPQEQAAPKSSPAAPGDSGTLVLTKDMQAEVSKEAKADGAVRPPNPGSPPLASTSVKPEPAKPSNSSQAPVSATPGGQSAAPSLPAPAPKPSITVPMERPKAPPSDMGSLNTNNMRTDHKPMEFSDRAMWFAVKMAGFWLKIMAGRGAIPFTAVSYYFEFFNDPFLSSVVITGGVWLLGQCTEAVGNWKLRFHRGTASTTLV